MVAVQTTLSLVEPQSSGLGGGAFVLYWDNTAKTLTTFDGRETAPMRATPELFLDKDGQPLKFMEAVVGGRSVGTPAIPKLMETIHSDTVYCLGENYLIRRSAWQNKALRCRQGLPSRLSKISSIWHAIQKQPLIFCRMVCRYKQAAC